MLVAIGYLGCVGLAYFDFLYSIFCFIANLPTKSAHNIFL
jgi:hypothetical protein